MVRSVFWDENVSSLGVVTFSAYSSHQNEVLVTGGEDSKIMAWHCPFPERFSVSAMDMESTILKRERDDDMDVCESEPVRMFNDLGGLYS